MRLKIRKAPGRQIKANKKKYKRTSNMRNNKKRNWDKKHKNWRKMLNMMAQSNNKKKSLKTINRY